MLYLQTLNFKTQIMVKIKTADLLKNYFNSVLERATHHAKEVEEITLTLMGAVIWKAIEGIEVRAFKDSTGNIFGNL